MSVRRIPVLLVLVVPLKALAGPPLICHPIEIGDAESLPLCKDGAGQNCPYEVSHLVEDALELLTAETPVLVRMETLRRATLYAKEHPDLALRLMSAVQKRVLDAEAEDANDPLVWFDAGYLMQCYEQNGMLNKSRSESMPGYRWVLKAQEMRKGDAHIALALSLMTKYCLASGKWKQHPAHESHLERARQGADTDRLLALNLRLHFQDRG